MNRTTDPYVTVADAATITDRSRRTIRTWIATGRVRTRTSSGTRYVHGLDALRESAARGRRRRVLKSRMR